MLTITGNGRLTRDPELRSTRTGDAVTTISVASDRRDRTADPVYVELVLWNAKAEAAVKHLVKGQQVAFSGRFEPRAYQTSAQQDRIALEIHDVALEYGSKPRSADQQAAAAADENGGTAASDAQPQDITR